MITLEQALHIVESVSVTLQVEKVPLMEALGRVMAQDVFSDSDMPPFNKAAMDGYACRSEDLDGEMKITEEIPAGKTTVQPILPGCCARIMTGAMVPEGADFVMMQEHVRVTSEGHIRCIVRSEQSNICYKGEDLRAGGRLLSSGQRLWPIHLAILASAGCTHPDVYRMPAVGVISTGNELVEPDFQPEPGKIRNSNGYQLTAQVRHFGLPGIYLGIVPDTREALSDMLAGAISDYPVVIISGGVSVGDYDYVPGILENLGVEILFHGLKVKPGRHMLIGKKGDRLVAGLPGNPISSFVMFEMLIKPLLSRMTGMTWQPLTLKMPLGIQYSRKKADTKFLIPVYFSHGMAIPLEYHGSAHIHSYAEAQGIMEVPLGVNEFKQGDIVHVRPL
jgi:molybdopterin molybdotransferase